jgi:nucleotide-binding universal stress UspA family protein
VVFRNPLGRNPHKCSAQTGFQVDFYRERALLCMAVKTPLQEESQDAEGEIEVKILLAIDGTSCSDAAVEIVAGRLWPARTEVRVISVVKPHVSLASGTPGPSIKYYKEAEMAEHQQALEVVERAANKIRSNGGSTDELKITTELFFGSPKRIIVEEAERWAADLIILGSHNRLSWQRRLLGSVSAVVAAHAACPVEIVRPGQHI